MKKPANPRLLALGVVTTLGLPVLHAAPQTWEGDSSALWSTGINWVGDPADVDVPGAGDIATFNAASTNTTIDLGAGVEVGQITFDTAATAAYTIGDGAVGSDSLTFSDNGEDPALVVTSTVTADQTIAANILLGPDAAVGDYQFDIDSTTNKLVIDGDIDTAAGGTAGEKRLEFGDFNTADIGTVDVNGNISNTGLAERILLLAAGANVNLAGQVAGDDGNTMRTIINNNGTITVGATGMLGEGSIEVRYGNLNLNNTSSPQLFDNGLIIGSIDQANGNATVTLDPGAIIDLDGDLNYRADDATANLGLVQGGMIALINGNRAIVARNNPLVDPATPELTVTSTVTNDGTNRNITFRGEGGATISLAPANADNDFGATTLQQGTLQLGDGALNINGSFLTLSARNNAATPAGTVATVDLMGTIHDLGESGLNLGNDNTADIDSGSATPTNGFMANLVDSVGGGVITGINQINYEKGDAGGADPLLRNGAATISASVEFDASGEGKSVKIEDGSADTDLTLAGNLAVVNAVDDITFFGDGALVITASGSISGHDRVTFSNQMTKLETGAVTGTGHLFVQQRNNATFSDFEPVLDINGQTIDVATNLVVNAYNSLNILETMSPRIIDSAGGGVIKLGGSLVSNEGDNTGGSSTIYNRTAFIEANLGMNGANHNFDSFESLDVIDLDISGTIIDDGTHNISKKRAGTLRLSATNNAFNILYIDDGTVIITNAGALGDNDVGLGTNVTDGFMEYTGSGESITNQFRVGDNSTTAGVRDGDGGILNNGTGDLTLTAAPFNEARGSATTNRTLTLGGSNGVNTIHGLVQDNAAAATVGVTKTGANTWILAGANTYTGDTDVQEGRLEVNGTVGGNLTVAGSASVGGDATFGGTVTLGSSMTPINLHVDGSTSSALTATGAIDTSNKVTVFVDAYGADGITVLNYDPLAANTISLTDFTLDGSVAVSPRLAGTPAFTDVGPGAITIDLGFESRTWNNASTDGLWNQGAGSSANWVEGDKLFYDGDLVSFGLTGAGTVTLAGNVAPNGMTIDVGANAATYTIDDNGGGETITLGGNLTVWGDDDAAEVTINCSIAGSGGVVKGDVDTDGDSGNLILTAANTYTGGTRVEQGILLINDNDALGTGTVTVADMGTNPDLRLGAGVTTLANDIVFAPDGTTKLISYYQVGTAEISGNIENNEGSDWAVQINVGNSSSLTISGLVSGVGAVRSRNGTLTLDNPANSFAGPLRVDNGGTSIVQSIADSGIASHAGAGSWIVVGSDNGDGTFSYTGTGASTDRQAQVGAGGGNTPDVMQTGGGTIANNGTGALIFTNATFTRQDTSNNGKVGARTLTLAGTNADDNEIQGAITDNAGTTGPDGTMVDNEVSLAKDGDGKWILSGANTYTGTTTVNAGTLLIDGSTTATLAVDVTAGLLGGNGSITSAVTVDPGAGLAFSVTDPGGVAGSDWSVLDITGTLDLPDPLVIKVDSLGASPFPETAGTMTMATTTGGISGLGTVSFDLGEFTGTGSFTASVAGNNLVLDYTPGSGDDYDAWGAAQGWTFGDPGTGKTDDYDGDGLTNDDERIFGLDPTSAASVNPITTGLPTGGTFSYHRRDDALSGLSYEIWTSSDLVNWTRDDAASQVEGPVDGDGIEEVTVTLTAAPVGGKLFAQVRVP